MKELIACGPNEICKAEITKKLAELKSQQKDLESKMCRQAKQQLDISYAQSFRMWKAGWDALRPATEDFYAFTDPVLRRIYVPSLNELLQVQRELGVLIQYRIVVGQAESLAAMADGFRHFDCMPMPPPMEGEEAKGPNLPQEKPPSCPFEKKPLSIPLGVATITLACDHAAIEGGEGFLFKARRDFKKHETTLWAGAGASSSSSMDLMMGKMAPSASLEASAGIGVVVGQGGQMHDVYITADLSAKIGIGSQSIGMSASGTAALEAGTSLSGELPGGIAGTVTTP